MLKGSLHPVSRQPLEYLQLFNRVAGSFPVSHRRLLSTASDGQVVFSGIQPTGIPHLGNYLGALQRWVELQNQSPAQTTLLFSIVDLHALTTRQNAAQLQQWKRETLAILLAVGLDPERSIIFNQSAVREHTELMWILSCNAPMGHLSRMTQWKSKIPSPDPTVPLDDIIKAGSKLGLFAYPILQAADILVHRATHVPVGQDQAQHLELARECAGSFNHVYGNTFPLPQTIMSTAKKIMSLKEPHLKMSKSHVDPRSRIVVTDSPDKIRLKIKVALTDSLEGVTYDPVARPGVSNLLDIMHHCGEGNASPESLAEDFKSLSLRAFKERVAESVIRRLAGVRAEYERLIQADNGEYLDFVAARGAERARANAEETMRVVRERVGLS